MLQAAASLPRPRRQRSAATTTRLWLSLYLLAAAAATSASSRATIAPPALMTAAAKIGAGMGWTTTARRLRTTTMMGSGGAAAAAAFLHRPAPQRQQQQQRWEGPRPAALRHAAGTGIWGPSQAFGTAAAAGSGGGADGGGPSPQALQRAPRLYFPDSPLRSGAPLAFTPDQGHYLTKVMRLRSGDWLRAFNPRDGEWACRLDGPAAAARPGGGKKRGGGGSGGPVTAVAERQLRAPLPAGAEPGLRLCFGVIKRARLKTLCEKATELGVTVLQPVITEYVDLRGDGGNNEELLAKMGPTLVEAAEQCERLSVPVLLPPLPLAHLLQQQQPQQQSPPSPLYICRERASSSSSPSSSAASASSGDAKTKTTEQPQTLTTAPLLHALDADAPALLAPGALPSFLVGPEGGFSPAELQAFDDAQNKQTNDPNNPAVYSSSPPVRCVSLGPSVLRAETAAAVALGCFGVWRDGRVSNGVGEGVEGA